MSWRDAQELFDAADHNPDIVGFGEELIQGLRSTSAWRRTAMPNDARWPGHARP